MDRQNVFAGEVIVENDVLSTNRDAYIGVGRTLSAILGGTTQLNGFACTPVTPTPNLSVNVGQGEIYILEAVDTLRYPVDDANPSAGLPPDPSLIVKQGITSTTANFPMAAPPTTGTSINYLIQIAFLESDAAITSRAFKNSADITNPIIRSITTARLDEAIITVKVGTAATTGTQVTPTPDAGNTGAWVVTVDNGQTQITSGDINVYPNAPFITDKLKDKISQAVADRLYEKRGFYLDSGTANNYILSMSSLYGTPPAYYNGMPANFFAKTANSGGASIINIEGVGVRPLVAPANVPLPPNVIDVNDYVETVYDASINSFIMTNIQSMQDAATALIGLSTDTPFTLTGGVGVKIPNFILGYQTASIWNSADERIQPVIPGWYRITLFSYISSAEQVVVYSVMNGTSVNLPFVTSPSVVFPAVTTEILLSGSINVYFDGTDYLELYIISSTNISVVLSKEIIGVGLDGTFIQVEYIGS